MAKTGLSKLMSYLQTLFLGGLLIQVVLCISGCLLSLISTSSDCSFPVRVWLISQASVTLFLLLLYFLTKCIGLSLFTLWNLVWSVLGLLWIFEDESCFDDYETGFTSTFLIICINMFLVLCIVFIAFLFAIATCIGFGLSSRYEEIES